MNLTWTSNGASGVSLYHRSSTPHLDIHQREWIWLSLLSSMLGILNSLLQARSFEGLFSRNQGGGGVDRESGGAAGAASHCTVVQAHLAWISNQREWVRLSLLSSMPGILDGLLQVRSFEGFLSRDQGKSWTERAEVPQIAHATCM